MAKRVMIVEDNELNLKLFTDLLRAHAFLVEPLADGAQAVERARSFQPNLIVMDIQLGALSGLDIISEMKRDARLKLVPILAVTAYAGKGDEERILSAGAEHYVSKPIGVAGFLSAVQETMRAR